MTDRIHAPWTEQQVAALNACQRSGAMTPFTCGNEQHRMHQTLVAESDGWHCPDESCDYRREWAYTFMVYPTAPVPIRTASMAVGVGLLERQGDGTERSGSFTGLRDPALAELKRTRQQLRATEEQLNEERCRATDLASRLAVAEQLLKELQIREALHDSTNPVPGACGEILNERAVWGTVATGGTGAPKGSLPRL